MSGMLESDLGTIGRICLELMFYVVGFQLAALAHMILCVWKILKAGIVEQDPFAFEFYLMRGKQHADVVAGCGVCDHRPARTD